MILRAERGRFRLTLQTDHAAICGQFAASWGGSHFRSPEPLMPVQKAAELHDQGWWEWELDPKVVGSTGQPYDFLSLPADEHTALYERGIQIALNEHPYTGLLVSLHGTGLYKERHGYMPHLKFREVDPAYRSLVDAYLSRQVELQQQLISDMRPDEGVLWTHYRWLQSWDLLSLFLALGDASERRRLNLGTVPRFPGGPEERLTALGVGPGRYCVSPWPFSVPELVVYLPVRYVAERKYTNDTEFQDAFRAAPTEPLALVLAPGLL